jgi:hypothetical protein
MANQRSIQWHIRGIASFLLGLVFCFIYIEMKKTEREELKKEQKEKALVKYTDPYMKGQVAKLGLHKGCWLPLALFPDDVLLDEIWEFPLHQDDIIVCSFPKSGLLISLLDCIALYASPLPGTTWVQEIVYLIVNDMDIEKACSANIEQRFPYIEYVYPGLKELSQQEGRRLMKSHLPYHHLPREIIDGKSKVIVT